MIKKHRRRIILPQHGKDTSDEIKHAAANRDCCWARIHFCGEKGGRVGAAALGKERRRGAHLMEGGEEMGCSCSGACMRERGGDEGGFIADAAACEHANEESKTKEIKEVLSNEN